MHEMSLVRSLMNQVKRLCHKHGGMSVKQIEVEIGPLSGVEPLLVREAFDQLASQISFGDAILVIHEIPLAARCRDCSVEFELPDFKFVCPTCRSQSICIIRGDEFRLLNISIATTDQPTCSSESQSVA